MENRFKKFYSSIKNILPAITVVVSLSALIFGNYSLKLDNANIFTISGKILTAITAACIGAMISLLTLTKFAKRRKKNVFISYSFKDKKLADLIYDALYKENYNIFYDSNLIQLGDNIREKIHNGIKKSDVVLLILPETHQDSKWVELEIQIAKENNVKIVPIVAHKNGFIPNELSDVKYADLSDINNDSIHRFIESLSNLIFTKARY